MRAWFELGDDPAPSLRGRLERRGALQAAVDLRKFDLDTVEHHHVLGHALGELADVREQQPALDREFARQGLHRRDTIVERRLWIVESEAAASDDGPIAHLIAAENEARDAA